MLNKQKTTVWANLSHAGQYRLLKSAIWLYGRSTMQWKTAKAVVGQHHWVDWSEYRRCCENDTRSCTRLEKLRIWPQLTVHDHEIWWWWWWWRWWPSKSVSLRISSALRDCFCISTVCNISSIKSLKDGYCGQAVSVSTHCMIQLLLHKLKIIWRDLDIALYRAEWSSTNS